jgi:hypothetical protein
VDEAKAQAIALHLVPRSGDEDDDYTRYAINAVLFDQLGDEDAAIWLPDRQPRAAHWLQGSYLFSVAGSMPDDRHPRVEVKSERLSDEWIVELAVRMSSDNPMGHAVLENEWIFRSPERTTIEIPGRVVIRDPQSHGQPDGDEEFARLLAARIGWPAAATAA